MSVLKLLIILVTSFSLFLIIFTLWVNNFIHCPDWIRGIFRIGAIIRTIWIYVNTFFRYKLTAHPYCTKVVLPVNHLYTKPLQIPTI